MLEHLLYHRGNVDKLAVIDGGQDYSYRMLFQKAAALARGLDCRDRENIAIFLPNSHEYICALFGVWMRGMTAFPMSVQLTGHELAPLIAQASVRTVVTSAAYRALFEDICSKSPDLNVNVIFMEDITGPYPNSLPHMLEAPPDTPIALLATSGTTGSAKIVQLTRINIETAVLGFIAYNDYPRFNDVDIRYILGAPFSSVYGLLILPVCLINAFALIIPKGAFTPDTLYGAAEEYGVTHYEGGTAIPILMDQMRAKPIPYDIGTLRFVGFGGSKVPAETLHRLDKAFPFIEFCPGYGMTESAALIARPYKRAKRDKRDSIGTAIPNVTVCVDIDGQISRARRVTGELVVKGPNVTPGYYKNPEETRKVIRDGWLYTGDIGYIDDDGDIFICGRKKNVVMVRGFSVYAEEVEASLQSSGLVKDCVVYGEADSDGGETLCADIIPLSERVSEEDIRLWCGAHMAAYKRPSRIRFIDAISKTSTGKIERAAREDGKCRDTR